MHKMVMLVEGLMEDSMPSCLLSLNAKTEVEERLNENSGHWTCHLCSIQTRDSCFMTYISLCSWRISGIIIQKTSPFILWHMVVQKVEDVPVILLWLLNIRVGSKLFRLQSSHVHHPLQQSDSHQFTSYSWDRQVRSSHFHQLGKPSA